MLNQPPSPLLHTALEAAQGSSGQIGQQQSLLKSSCFLLLHFLPSPEALPSKESGGDKAWLFPSDSLHPINPVCRRYRRKEIPWCLPNLPTPFVQLSSSRTRGPPALLPGQESTTNPPVWQTPSFPSAAKAPSVRPHHEAEEQPLPFPFLAASPGPGCFSPSPALSPHSPRAAQSRKGKQRSSYLRTPPEGSRAGFGVILSCSWLAALGREGGMKRGREGEGREGWRGPADSSQMLAKCSYVITVLSIPPRRPW